MLHRRVEHDQIDKCINIALVAQSICFRAFEFWYAAIMSPRSCSARRAQQASAVRLRGPDLPRVA